MDRYIDGKMERKKESMKSAYSAPHNCIDEILVHCIHPHCNLDLSPTEVFFMQFFMP